jgi:hypothetical protein
LIQKQEWATFKLLPDRSLENKNTERLADALYPMYSPIFTRIKFDQGQVNYIPKPYAVWEILISHKDISFFLSVPKKWATFTQQELGVCWGKSTIQPTRLQLNFPEELSIGGIITLAHHYFLSISTDRRTLNPLPSIMEVCRPMVNLDRALIQILLDPAPSDWYTGAQEALKRFQAGEMPHRIEITPRRAFELTVKAGAVIGLGVINTIAEILTEKDIVNPIKPQTPGRINLTRQGLSLSTTSKTKGNAFDVSIRVLVYSQDSRRRDTIIRGVATGFRSLNGDNEFVFKPVSDIKRFIPLVKERTLFITKVNNDYLSTAEVGRLIQLPPLSLQEEFPVESIPHRELEIPEYLRRKGIPLGEVTHKGSTFPVIWPINNLDEFCMTRVVIGGMGTGKTMFGAGFATDVLREGYSVFAIEAADGDFTDVIRDSLPSGFPEDHIIDLDFGNLQNPIPLNWGEVSRRTAGGREVANAISSHLVSYLSRFATEAGDRTERYLRAAGKAVFLADPESSLLEVFLMLCSPEYRKNILGAITDLRLKELWDDFDHMTDGMKAQVIAPVLSRLDVMLNNEYISNCLLQRPKTGIGRIDFRAWADGNERGPYCVLLRAPKSILLDEGTDAIITWLIAKLWLAILTRIDQPTNLRKPAFLIMDEPAQYLGSSRGGVRSTWGSMITEARKWRLGLVFMFHEWQQLGKELGGLIKSAGAHYVLYSSSKETFQGLSEEINPFTIEEAIKIPTHSAICIVKAESNYHKFMAKMALPPIGKKKGWRYPYVDRSSLLLKCSEKYGRQLEEVEMNIYQREKILFQAGKKK